MITYVHLSYKDGYKNDSMVISIAPVSSINIKICPLARQLGHV